MPAPTAAELLTFQDQQFDRVPMTGASLWAAVATPNADAVTSENNANTRAVATGSTTPNPRPLESAHRDYILNAIDAASMVRTPTTITVAAAAPTGSSPTASCVLTWDAVAGATFKVQRSFTPALPAYDPGTDWQAGTPATAGTATSTQTGLSSGVWRFRVAAVVGGVTAAYSAAVAVTVP